MCARRKSPRDWLRAWPIFVLQDLRKALKGLAVMSEELDHMATSVFNNQVPSAWAAKAYPSLKPLSLWIADLRARVDFMAQWIKEGAPPAFWISGFFFPQVRMRMCPAFT